MRPIRIFIISDSLLFIRGLEKLLAYEAGVDIIGNDLNITHALQQIEQEAPDVVILSMNNHDNHVAFEELNLLKARPGIRVISLNLNSNDLFTYCVSRREVTSISDLVEAIEADACKAEDY